MSFQETQLFEDGFNSLLYRGNLADLRDRDDPVQEQPWNNVQYDMQPTQLTSGYLTSKIFFSGNDLTLFDDTTGGTNPPLGDSATFIFRRTDDNNTTDHPQFNIRRRAGISHDSDNVVEMFWDSAALDSRENYLFIGRDGTGSNKNLYRATISANDEVELRLSGFSTSEINIYDKNPGSPNTDSASSIFLEGNFFFGVGLVDNDFATPADSFLIDVDPDTIEIGRLFEKNELTNKTSNAVELRAYRKELRTSGTTADSYDGIVIKRTSIMDGTGGTLTSAGQVCKIQNVSTETNGTLTDTVTVLYVLQNNVSTGNLSLFENNSTGHGIAIQQDGVLANSKYGLYVLGSSANVNSSNLVFIHDTHASTTHDVMQLTNDGTGIALNMNQVGVLANSKYGIKIYSDAVQTNTSNLVFIHDDNTSTTHDVVSITNDGTGTAFYINQVGVNANTKYGFQVYSNGAQTNSSNLVFIHDDNSSTTHDVIQLTNDGTGSSLKIDSTGVLASTKYGIYSYSDAIQINSYLFFAHSDNASSTADVCFISNDGTGDSLNIDQNGVLASSKYGLNVYSNAAQVNSPLVYVHQDNASSTANVVEIVNDGTGSALEITQTTAPAQSEYVLYVNSNVARTSANSHLLNIREDHASTTDDVVIIVNDGTGIGFQVDQNGVNVLNHYAMYINSNVAQVNDSLVLLEMGHASSDQILLELNNEGTGGALKIAQNGVLAASEYGMSITSTVALTNAGSRLFLLSSTNTSTTVPTMLIDCHSIGKALFIDKDANVTAGNHLIAMTIDMDSSSAPASAAHMHALQVSVDAADADIVECAFNFNGSELTTSDPTQATNDIWIRCYDDVNNEVFYIRGYTA